MGVAQIGAGRGRKLDVGVAVDGELDPVDPHERLVPPGGVAVGELREQFIGVADGVDRVGAGHRQQVDQDRLAGLPDRGGRGEPFPVDRDCLSARRPQGVDDAL